MQQLMMLRPAASVTPRPLPAGYAFVPFGGTQAEISDWLTVCAAGLLPNTDAHWFEDSIRNYPDLDPARDLFFVTDAGGARIATSAAVRHADGTHLEVIGTREADGWHICCRNDGAVPTGPIVEGGGLSLLRAQVEAAGGAMRVDHAPRFLLTLVFRLEHFIHRSHHWNCP